MPAVSPPLVFHVGPVARDVGIHMLYGDDVSDRSIVVTVAATDINGRPVTASSANVRLSESLGAEFFYAPAARAGTQTSKRVQFDDLVDRLEIAILTWPERRPVADSTFTRVFASVPVDGMMAGSTAHRVCLAEWAESDA